MKRLKTLAVVRIGWIEYGFESEKDAISFLSMAKKSLMIGTFGKEEFDSNVKKIREVMSLSFKNEGIKLISNDEFRKLEDIEHEEIRKSIIKEKAETNGNPVQDS